MNTVGAPRHYSSWLSSQVALHVQRQVVAPAEGALAEVALEGAVAGVLAVVTRQLVRARELPAAALPRAGVRLFPSVSADVGLEVRALGVGFGAARVRAGVHRLAAAAPRSAPAAARHWRRHHAVLIEMRHQQVQQLRRCGLVQAQLWCQVSQVHFARYLWNEVLHAELLQTLDVLMT